MKTITSLVDDARHYEMKKIHLSAYYLFILESTIHKHHKRLGTLKTHRRQTFSILNVHRMQRVSMKKPLAKKQQLSFFPLNC